MKAKKWLVGSGGAQGMEGDEGGEGDGDSNQEKNEVCLKIPSLNPVVCMLI